MFTWSQIEGKPTPTGDIKTSQLAAWHRKFHKRNINTEIILKLACNFCRRSSVMVYLALYIMPLAIRSPDGEAGGT